MRKHAMDVTEAIDRISEIHEQLAKAEVHRGSRPLPVLISGLFGLGAAALQPWLVSGANPLSFLRYWVIAGVICGAVAASEIVLNYTLHEDTFSRRKTRQVIGQFLPCLLAGTAVTIVLGAREALIPLLPGLWAMTFSIGIFAARPYLPRTTGWLGLYYFCSGTWLLMTAVDASALSGWRVGATFGIGQVAAALVLHLHWERENHGKDSQD
jgi:hypothetical protein